MIILYPNEPYLSHANVFNTEYCTILLPDGASRLNLPNRTKGVSRIIIGSLPKPPSLPSIPNFLKF